MEETKNLQGSFDLLQLNMAHVREIKGRTKTLKCIIIPIEENGMYVKLDQATLRPLQVKLNMDIYKSQKPGQYGDTHYAKLHLSNEFEEKFGQDVTKSLRDKYFGNFRPLVFKNDASSMNVPTMEDSFVTDTNEDLPF